MAQIEYPPTRAETARFLGVIGKRRRTRFMSFRDMWVTGSRQFRDFDEYLLAGVDYTGKKNTGKPPLITTDGSARYLQDPDRSAFCSSARAQNS